MLVHSTASRPTRRCGWRHRGAGPCCRSRRRPWLGRSPCQRSAQHSRIFSRVLCHRTVCVFAIVPMVSVVMHPRRPSCAPVALTVSCSSSRSRRSRYRSFHPRSYRWRWSFRRRSTDGCLHPRGHCSRDTLFQCLSSSRLPAAQLVAVVVGIFTPLSKVPVPPWPRRRRTSGREPEIHRSHRKPYSSPLRQFWS